MLQPTDKYIPGTLDIEITEFTSDDGIKQHYHYLKDVPFYKGFIGDADLPAVSFWMISAIASLKLSGGEENVRYRYQFDIWAMDDALAGWIAAGVKEMMAAMRVNGVQRADLANKFCPILEAGVANRFHVRGEYFFYRKEGAV